MGVLILNIILQGMGKSLSQGIEIPIVVSVSGIFLSFSVAVIVSLLSAWLPVRRASRLPIKDVVLGTVEEKHTPHRLIIGTGIALFIISVLLPKNCLRQYALLGRWFFSLRFDCRHDTDYPTVHQWDCHSLGTLIWSGISKRGQTCRQKYEGK